MQKVSYSSGRLNGHVFDDFTNDLDNLSERNEKLRPSEIIISDSDKQLRNLITPSASSISIVVCCYSMERYNDLVDLFRSVEFQSVQCEIVVVVERDQKLRDKINSFLQSSTLSWALIYSKSRLGLSNARNLGMEMTAGTLVGFVDDDAALSRDWAKEAVAAFCKRSEIIGLTGPILPQCTSESLSWFPKSLYWIIGCTDTRHSINEELGLSVSGANMIFRREVFERVKFVDKFTDGAQEEGKMGLPGEDVDFAIRAVLATNRKILYTPKLIVHHKVYSFKLTNKYVRRYSFWQGVAESRYDRNYKGIFRNSSRASVLISLLSDVKLTKVDALRRNGVILNFLLFASLGFFAFRSPSVLRQIIKML